MTPKELLIHKLADKKILAMPEFRNVIKKIRIVKAIES